MQRLTSWYPILGLAFAIQASCKSVGDSQTEAIPFFSSPGQFVSVKGRISPHSGSIRLLKISSFATFKATRPGLPTCTPNVPKEDLESLSPSGQANVMTNFNRAQVIGSDGFEVQIPARLGPALNVCGFVPLDPPYIDFTVLNQVGALETFRLNIALANTASSAPVQSLDLLRGSPATFSVGPNQGDVNLKLPELSLTPSRVQGQTSFAQLWDQIVKTRLPPKPLPNETGISSITAGVGVVGNALGIDSRDERVRADQQRALTSTGDTRADTPKAFHPLGICAKARWRVHARSTYSGLFHPATDLPAIIRFSTGGNNTSTQAELGFHRMPAVAVKIFPGEAADPSQLTESRNLVLFDEQGPIGNTQAWFLFDSLSGENRHFFSNWIFGTDLFAQGTTNAFGRLVFNARHLPLTALASVQAGGSYETSESLVVPRFVKISYDGKRKPEKFQDLRDELSNYGDNELHFKVAVFPNSASPAAVPSSAGDEIAELTEISAPILSTFCDRPLFFHHAPH